MIKKLCIVCGEPLDKNQIDFHPECEHEGFFRGIVNAERLQTKYKEHRVNYNIGKKKRGRRDE